MDFISLLHRDDAGRACTFQQKPDTPNEDMWNGLNFFFRMCILSQVIRLKLFRFPDCMRVCVLIRQRSLIFYKQD